MLMKKEVKNIPVLRFPEFDGEWEETRLGSICSTFKSGTGITADRINEKGNYPVFGGNGLRGYTDSYTHSGFYVLIGRQGALCGNINRVSGDSFISEHAIAVRANDTSDTEWLAQKLEYFNLNRLSESSAQPGLAVNKLVRLKVIVPTLPEQQKTASFLTAVDKKIKQLTRKKELLEQYKKGVMQKIFSQEIRFKDDNGEDYPDWKEKSLGEIFSSFGGTALEKYVVENGDYKFISIGNYSKTGHYIDTGQRILLNEKTQTRLLKRDDLVMVLNDKTKTGDLIGSTILINKDGEYIYNQRSEKIVCKDAVTPKYLWTLLNSPGFRKTVFSISQGGTQIYVNFSAIKKLNTPLPSIKEQQKIADFISSIDTKINTVQTQLTQTKNFKKGLLQKMFV